MLPRKHRETKIEKTACYPQRAQGDRGREKLHVPHRQHREPEAGISTQILSEKQCQQENNGPSAQLPEKEQPYQMEFYHPGTKAFKSEAGTQVLECMFVVPALRKMLHNLRIWLICRALPVTV